MDCDARCRWGVRRSHKAHTEKIITAEFLWKIQRETQNAKNRFEKWPFASSGSNHDKVEHIAQLVDSGLEFQICH